MNDPKISIIVPVYKVEPYLRKCLDSIVNQTYQNLQIILVDDGSPDQSGMICDAYAKQDFRIEVIHLEKNCGVSAARNVGLKMVVGDYIGWVDSDDWIAPDMYEYLLEKIEEADADIAVCGHYEYRRGKAYPKSIREETVCDTETALELLLCDEAVHNYLWDKLFRKELFTEIHFPEGKTYEDVAVMHRLFMYAKISIFLPKLKYCYIQHTDGIVGNSSLENRLNYYRMSKQRYEEMAENWPQFKNLLAAHRIASAVGVWASVLTTPKEIRKNYDAELQEISEFASENIKSVKKNIHLGPIGKITVHLLPYVRWWAFAAAWCLGKVYKLKHGRNL